VVFDTGKYRIDLVMQSGDVQEAELLYLDVVHDLALLKPTINQDSYFEIIDTPPKMGEKIYSFGNPQDLGFTIIEGNYNGPIKESRLEKLNFSGSLNPGMSGGPAINSKGQIVGVNVATAGSQLSFLVPARFIKAMMLELDIKSGIASDGFLSLVEEQVLADQQEKFAGIFSKPLEKVSLGTFSVPSALLPSLKCWSVTEEEKEELYSYLKHVCSTSEFIFLNKTQQVGNLYLYFVLLINEGLNQFSFAATIERLLKGYNSGGKSTKEFVSNYSCEKSFVRAGEANFWVNSCIRRYKKTPKLYDITLVAASVDSSSESLLVYTSISAVSLENTQSYVREFLEGISWNRQ
jgi:hypothetical protein